MKRSFLSLSLFPLLSLWACTSQPDYRAEIAPPETVAMVDLDRYVGLWYEIARYPNSFQKKCEGVTAEYTRREDGKITVLNTCRAGKERTAKGVARVIEASNGAKLKVKFAPEWIPFAEGDYWVLALDEDYTSALVGSPSGKYLWILSRTPKLDEARLTELKARAEILGYDIEPLKMTDQPEI